MKAHSLIIAVAANAALLYLAYQVNADLAARLAYSTSIGFSPSLSYSAFSYVLTETGTSLGEAGVFIPGLLTVDWRQVLLVALALFDAYVLPGVVHPRVPARADDARRPS